MINRGIEFFNRIFVEKFHYVSLLQKLKLRSLTHSVKWYEKFLIFSLHLPIKSFYLKDLRSKIIIIFLWLSCIQPSVFLT